MCGVGCQHAMAADQVHPWQRRQSSEAADERQRALHVPGMAEQGEHRQRLDRAPDLVEDPLCSSGIVLADMDADLIEKG